MNAKPPASDPIAVVLHAAKASGRTSRDLAQAAGMSHATAHRLMNGQRLDAVRQFLALARALGVDVTAR